MNPLETAPFTTSALEQSLLDSMSALRRDVAEGRRGMFLVSIDPRLAGKAFAGAEFDTTQGGKVVLVCGPDEWERPR